MYGIYDKIHTYMWDLKYDTNELTYKTETDMESKLTVTKGEKVQRRDKLGVQDQDIKTTAYKIDNQ